MSRADGKAAGLIVTLGPWHDKPWWWAQLDHWPVLQRLRYERLTFGDRQQRDLGLRALPGLVRRLYGLLRRARRDGVEYVFTFESDWSCYLLGLLQSLPGLRRKPRHVILQFISREHDGTAASTLKDLIAGMCLRSVHRVVCSSRSESEYYSERFGWPAGKSAFVPFHTDRRLLDMPPQPAQDFIIAAGRSYRDYETLARAVAGTGIRTLIVCGRRGPGISSLPPEVEVISELPFATLMDKIACARIVILPLTQQRISTGQTVLLQAMALGRPVITTRTAGTEDYIRDGEDGVLVAPRVPEELRDAIRRVWHDAELQRALGERARAAVSARFLPMHYATQVAGVLGCEPARAESRAVAARAGTA